MLYIPGLIFCWYMYLATRVQKSPPDYVAGNIICNLLLSELVWYLGSALEPVPFSIWNLFGFYLVQSVYFYVVHRWVMHSPAGLHVHAKHHEILAGYAAWYAHPAEHLFLNLGSVAVAFAIFRNSSLALLMLIIGLIYNGVRSHASGSNHAAHHANPKVRYGLGGFYELDRLFGTY